MEYTRHDIHGVTVLELRGRLDITGSEGLERRLLDEVNKSSGNILLNMSDVNYMSSSGISAILGAARGAKAKNRKLALCAISPSIMKLLEVVELGNIFPVYPTQAEGVEGLK